MAEFHLAFELPWEIIIGTPGRRARILVDFIPQVCAALAGVGERYREGPYACAAVSLRHAGRVDGGDRGHVVVFNNNVDFRVTAGGDAVGQSAELQGDGVIYLVAGVVGSAERDGLGQLVAGVAVFKGNAVGGEGVLVRQVGTARNWDFHRPPRVGAQGNGHRNRFALMEGVFV